MNDAPLGWQSNAEQVARCLGEAKRVGKQWSTLCPAHDDHDPSLTIADGDDGSLLVRCHAGCSQDQVIAALRRLGLWPDNPISPPSRPKKEEWHPIVPPPADAPRPSERQLRCDMLHEYRDADDRLLFYVRRHEAKGDKRKQFYPLTYGTLVKNGKPITGWHDKAPDTPRPLYRLNVLARWTADATVLLCEGEKAADAAQRMFPDMVAMSWMGGSKADGNADLSPIAGHPIMLWPDADKVGRDAMQRIAKRLPGSRIISTDGLPEGFDAADLEAFDVDPVEWLAARTRVQPEETPPPPEPPPAEDHLPGLRDHLAIEAWAVRPMPPPDRLLGDLLTTTSRMFLVGRTGLGKTMLGFAMACGIASSRGFLHWRCGRPARVLYVDGEMPGELIKSRSIDALRRTGIPPPPGNLLIYSRDTEEDLARQFPTPGMMPPLNTEAGHNFILTLIAAVGGVDAVIFDNVMSLIAGDHREEIPWNETLPLVGKLTARRIGQVWLDHTGHNTERQYGSSTKAWRFDAVGVMTPLPDDQRGRHELAFTLSFEHPGKARRRTPDNWRDFETCTIRLKDDRWTSEPVGPAVMTRKLSPTGEQFYRAFLDALAISGTPGRTTRAIWFAEAARTGLAEPVMSDDDYKAKSAKQSKFRKYLIEIKAAGLIGVNGDTVTDLRTKP